MGCAKIPHLTNFWLSSLFIHSPLEDTLSSMCSTINKILVTFKNESLHNLILTIRPIILLVCRHLLLYVSKTLKLSMRRRNFLCSALPTDLSPSHFHPWLRPHHCWVVQARDLRIILACLPTFKCYILCPTVYTSKQPQHMISTARGSDLKSSPAAHSYLYKTNPIQNQLPCLITPRHCLLQLFSKYAHWYLDDQINYWVFLIELEKNWF